MNPHKLQGSLLGALPKSLESCASEAPKLASISETSNLDPLFDKVYYVISCYIMLYHAILCYIMVYYAILWYIMLYYGILCYIVVYYGIL